jgi:hypothetical protein
MTRFILSFPTTISLTVYRSYSKDIASATKPVSSRRESKQTIGRLTQLNSLIQNRLRVKEFRNKFLNFN